MMKFFTPDLVARFASEDPSVAHCADQEWESATRRYRKHLDKLPPKLKEFAESVCLHDAQYLGISKIAGPFVEGGPAVVTLKQGEQFIFLVYFLVSEPAWQAAPSTKTFQTNELLWLYDEIHVEADGTFLHEILLSNGKVLALHFVSFDRFVVEQRRAVSTTLAKRPVQPPSGMTP